ncbi:UDP-N-acetylmuramoyl-L-alanine--D-glutamate ligase [Anaeromicropila populeti]|uniref:UDP-N-acetylmuramoylalanine--D-glutamate ligase n=1 Tax=Anaeromicropila populeti TaxID=37658 RepID=A0A1I6KX12_9FIRM|nr:UDP-N-acetylmuramoyl-L-alanine--D-glutamate ligase [Anaeromicropila populeti]SFR95714.1 UDP-N-acetylmuramoylalanine--D-glutamate ligase [Anaeromicropila populeti]
MEFKGKTVLVIGTKISGIAAANLLLDKKADVILFDANINVDRKELETSIDGKVTIALGELKGEEKSAVDLVILSPGVPAELPMVCEFRERNIPIWGEIELAYQCGKGKVVAITGTNGKTTTTSLVGEIMKSYYKSVFVVGNIGIPYTGVVQETKQDSVIVAEISSFQLETIHEFRPQISAILNITPDHLDRHHTMENYIDAKLSVAKNQSSMQYCILNYEDEVLRERSNDIAANVWFFSSEQKLEVGIYLNDAKDIIYADGIEEVLICNVKELKLLGRHNYENVMAGVLIAIKMGVPYRTIRETLLKFRAVEHRIEYVTSKKGIAFYNDSKGTNPDAAIKGIQAMETPTLLIGGGYDKMADYTEWIKAFNGKVRYLVLIGQTRDKIAEAAKKCGFHNIILAESLEEAIQICYEKAMEGDSVLLSPACASWGMFKNYEERGRMFKEYVNQLAE